ncbi:DUF3887 domain-containing protein [Acinetobacter tandoii]|uniref:DUF3887 domain-containing protein n=1 Tax=Acinetobacter tandoii TaxID=202954 RepID=UPI0040465780
MMKMKYAILASVLAFSGCDKLGQQANIPDPSPQQVQAAQEAYDDLRAQNFDQLMTHFEPELQARYQGNQKDMQKFARGLPQENYKTKKIVSKKLLNESNQPSKYTVTYEYAYDKNLVQYDVSFDKPDGSSKIRDISVSVFGEKIE